MNDQPDLSLHQDFETTFGQAGGLLDVPAGSELHLNVGRRCVGAGSEFLASNELMTVTALQRIHDGSLAYRVSRGPGDFGRPARPEEVCWVPENEPAVTLIYRSEYSNDLEMLTVPVSRQEAAVQCLRQLGWPLLSVQH